MADLAICITISCLVHAVWCGLEMLFYGEIQPRAVDDIMSFIITLSLYCNYKQAKEKDDNG